MNVPGSSFVVVHVQDGVLLQSRTTAQTPFEPRPQNLYSGVAQPAAAPVNVTGTPGCCGDATFVVTLTDVQGDAV